MDPTRIDNCRACQKGSCKDCKCMTNYWQKWVKWGGKKINWKWKENANPPSLPLSLFFFSLLEFLDVFTVSSLTGRSIGFMGFFFYQKRLNELLVFPSSFTYTTWWACFVFYFGNWVGHLSFAFDAAVGCIQWRSLMGEVRWHDKIDDGEGLCVLKEDYDMRGWVKGFSLMFIMRHVACAGVHLIVICPGQLKVMFIIRHVACAFDSISPSQLKDYTYHDLVLCRKQQGSLQRESCCSAASNPSMF